MEEVGVSTSEGRFVAFGGRYGIRLAKVSVMGIEVVSACPLDVKSEAERLVERETVSIKVELRVKVRLGFESCLFS